MTILNLSESLRDALAKWRYNWHPSVMLKKLLPALLIVLVGCLSPLSAQNNEADDSKSGTDVPQKNRFWQANVSGGEYMVALDRISAISRHQYVLDGAVLVDEVTVDALGQALVRFYFLSPITDAMGGNATGRAISRVVDRGREVAEAAAGKAGINIENMVVKKFPETTHAKEIEYRVLSEQELSGLYKSVRTAWETGRGRKFAIK